MDSNGGSSNTVNTLKITLVRVLFSLVYVFTLKLSEGVRFSAVGFSRRRS